MKEFWHWGVRAKGTPQCKDRTKRGGEGGQGRRDVGRGGKASVHNRDQHGVWPGHKMGGQQVRLDGRSLPVTGHDAGVRSGGITAVLWGERPGGREREAGTERARGRGARWETRHWRTQASRKRGREGGAGERRSEDQTAGPAAERCAGCGNGGNYRQTPASESG